MKLIGFLNTNSFKVDIGAMLMHFSDTAYFRPKLLEFIRKGECAPKQLGSFIDSYQKRDKDKLKFIYGAYDGVLDQIKDMPNLNSRRRAIGMPTVEMQQKRDSLMKAKYDFL